VSPVVVLVGPPGSGKTTVGGLLARRLGVNFRDTDSDIEALEGKEIADIFVDDGEERFRKLERDAVAAAIREHDGVLAVGGGAVTSDETRRLLTSAQVVFLDVGLAHASSRVGLGTSRPLLLGNVRAQLKRLLDERRPLYAEIADTVVGTDGLDPAEVTELVAARVRA
jgi:shikimate kinase